jgi:flagellar biosynthesis chaperone FliJ
VTLSRQVRNLLAAAKSAIDDLEGALESASDERDDALKQLESMTAERDKLWDRINEGES